MKSFGFEPWSRCAFAAVVILLTGCGEGAKSKRSLAEAERYFVEGNYDSAEIEYKNALQSNPRDPLAFRQLGVIFLERGDALRAAQFLHKAREIAPQDVDVRAAYAEAILSLGAIVECRKEVTAVLEQKNDHGKALLLLVETSNTEEELAMAGEKIKRASKDSGNADASLAGAVLALRAGDVAAANLAIAEALRQEPERPLAHVLKASLQWLQKDLRAADESFQVAMQHAAARSPERLKYADFLRKTGRIPEAIKVLEDAVSKAPDFLPAWRTLAQIAIEETRFADAEKSIDHVLSRNARDLEAPQLQAQLALAQGNAPKALKILEETKAQMPPHPELEFQLARAYLMIGNTNLAMEALRRVIGMNPDHAEAPLQLANVLLSRKESDKAVEILQDYLVRHPENDKAQFLLAESYRMQKRLADASAVLQKRMESGQAGAQEHLALGLVLKAQNQKEGARQQFEKAAQLSADNLLAVSQLVALELQEKNFSGAEARVQQMLQKNPGSAALHYLLATVYEQQKKWDQAESSLKEAIRIRPEFLAAYGSLVQIYAVTERTREATEQLQQFLQREPDHLPAWMQLGVLHQQAGRSQEAKQCYEKLIELNPSFAPALNNLAIIESSSSGDSEKAYHLARKAREVMPNDGSVADTLGWILFQRGEIRNSFTLLQEAVGLLPGDPIVQLHFGFSAYQMNLPEIAGSAFQKALAARVDFPERSQAERRVAFLTHWNSEDRAGLERRVSDDPKDLIAMLRLGQAWEAENRFDDALKCYENAARLNPDLAQPWFLRAKLFAGPVKDWKKALEDAGKARERAPEDPQVAALLGRASFETGNQEWAYQLLKECRVKLASDPQITRDHAWASYSMGRIDEAKTLMQECVKASSHPALVPEARQFLDCVSLDLKSPSMQLASVEPLLAANPSYVPALMVKAALLEGKDEAQATAIYEKVLGIYPHFAPAQKYLAGIYVDREEKIAAADDLARKARETLEDDAELTGIMARIKYRQRDFTEARRLLVRVSEQRKLASEEAYVLGMCFGELGEKDKAREWLQLALNGTLSSASSQQARQMLVKLQ